MMRIEIDSGSGSRSVDLLSYLDGASEERAQDRARAWIKALRGLDVEGAPFRSRFTYRGDSLWWFAELYLHKTQEVLRLHRTILAFGAMVEAERPIAIACAGPRAWLVRALAQSARLSFHGRAAPPRAWAQVVLIDARAAMLEAAARASRLRTRRAAAGGGSVAAFIHKAFWRDATGGGAESYIGPVLRELEQRAGDVRYVAVGPRTNFRARRWWDPLRSGAPSATPVEALAPYRALADSRALWRERHRIRRALWSSAAIRAHAVIAGCDCWPSIREQLAGVALLQFTWSARTMDEAAAALDALRPRVAITYAEAGGWGRAIAIECRRRSIPFVGLQHGFIYRHWLNYRHEPDEMLPDPRNPADAGFPAPALTLAYDEFAADHLRRAARLAPEAVRVTGSPGLEALAAAVRALSPEQRAGVRRELRAGDHDRIVLVATKEREARRILPAFLEAAGGMDGLVVAIKPHPAETPDVYARAAAAGHVRVLPASTPLPSLLAVADAVVTVNSTVAIDSLVLGVPSLVIGLPNNLSPFVDAGVMAGANTVEEMRAGLARVLYDQEFRNRLLGGATTRTPPEGAAARAAAAVLGHIKESQT